MFGPYGPNQFSVELSFWRCALGDVPSAMCPNP